MAFFIVNALLIRVLGHYYGVNASLLTAMRFVTGLAFVAVPFLPSGRTAWRAVLRNPWLIARGVIGGSGVYLYYETVTVLGAGRATLLNNTYIAMGAVLAAIFLRERLRPMVFVALGSSLTGVALLTQVSLQHPLSAGDALALLGALASAVVIVLIRKLHERENTTTIFAAQCAWGLTCAAAPTVANWSVPGPLLLALVVLSGVLAAIGQLTMTSAYKRLPVAEGSLFQALLPLGIGLGGVWLFGEHYTSGQVIGGLLIVTSCLLAAHTRPRLSAGLPPASTAQAVEAECTADLRRSN